MFLVALLALTAARPADPLKLEHAGAGPPEALAEPVRKLLPDKCERVSDAAGVIAEVWLRDDLPATATADQVKNGLTLRELPPGLLLGAVRFPKAFTDYRKQDIPAGVYTLRFAVQPETGDHTGTAPHPEFALLVPAADDTTADPVELKALVKLSLKATGGDHPGVVLLFPHAGKPGPAELKPRADGTVTLNVIRPASTGDAKGAVGFGLVVSGYSKSR